LILRDTSEAHEKANEIRLKGEHDFSLEKQSLIHSAKLKVLEDIAKKSKDAEVQQRIALSTAIGSSKVQKMKYREQLLANLETSATQRLTLVSADANYTSLLQKLIVQSLIKIEETELTIYSRSQDSKAVKQVLPAAIKELTALMKDKSGITIIPKVKVNDDASKNLPESSCGGIVITALDGRLVCDNTLSSRLGIVREELEPAIRELLFPMEQLAN
jgi:V-type H+-transporting ATPase subunit E